MNIRFIRKRNIAQLEEPYNVRLCGVMYSIPQGFTFDGASIPAFLWGILFLHPFHHKVRRAGLLHDYLYKSGDRGVADAILRGVLKEDRLDIIRRNILYYGVRLFDWMFHGGK